MTNRVALQYRFHPDEVTFTRRLDEQRPDGGARNGSSLQLNGPFFSTPIPEGGHRRDDRSDLGFAELTDAQINKLSSDHFLVPGDLAQNEAADPRWQYMMLRYRM